MSQSCFKKKNQKTQDSIQYVIQTKQNSKNTFKNSPQLFFIPLM